MSQSKESIVFIGAGNMASSIIRGLVDNGYPSSQITASAPSDRNLNPLKNAFGITTTHNNTEYLANADILVLGVKPQIMQSTCEEIAHAVAPSTLIISLAAGVTCENLNRWLGGDEKPHSIVRCMSNTPAQVLTGASGLYANSEVSEHQKSLTHAILSTVGTACWVDKEALIDTVTAISGSGPAYFFLFIESIIEAGIAQGMPADVARELAIQTALGAAQLAKQSEDDVVELRRKVTSPKGTTERAILSFEDNNLRGVVKDAMDACTARAKELGK